jgi:hypothetical protein
VSEWDDDVLVRKMKFQGRDLGTIGLPLQIGGAAVVVLGLAFRHWLAVEIGAAAHVAGDTFFFFQMKKQGCL